MHSVDITPEMKESVMEEQVMFSKKRGGLAKENVEKGFGGIWIADKQEYAKFVSAVNNYVFEEDGEGIAYTDNYFYAYYWNIDKVPTPFAPKRFCDIFVNDNVKYLDNNEVLYL